MKGNNAQALRYLSETLWSEEKKNFVGIFMPLNLCVSIFGSQIESKTCSKALPDSTEKYGKEGITSASLPVPSAL